MRQYETTFILRPNLGEDQFTEIIERTCGIITADGGAIIDTDRWGIKRLAYEIKKEVQGYYVCLNYAAPGKAILEIERIFRIDDRLLRFLTIKLADSIDTEGINKAKDGFAAQATTEDETETEQTGADDKTKEESTPKETATPTPEPEKEVATVDEETVAEETAEEKPAEK